MKNILLLLAFFSLLSCSNDDNAKPAIEAPANTKFIKKITYTGIGTSYNFEYNADKTVRKITSSMTDDSFAHVLAFTYQDGLITVIEQINTNNTIRTTFSYDANRRITGVTTANNYRRVTYNAPDNSYISTSPEGRPMKFYVTADGDVSRNVQQNQNDETSSGLIFNPDKFGALYNTNAITLHLCLIRPSNILSFGERYSKRPVENTTNGPGLAYENTYDSQGFITSAEINSATARIAFEYTQL